VPLLDFGPRETVAATHGLHAFAAKCPPHLARWAIEEFTRPGGLVLDPMAGSGTTLVEALVTGRRGMGIEMDPLARLIASAKATPISLDELDRQYDRLEHVLLAGGLNHTWRPALPNLEYWFRNDVASDLARLRHAIQLLAQPTAVRRFYWVAFSSLLVARTSVANARDIVHSRHHYRPLQEDPGTISRYQQRLRTMRRQMAQLLTSVSNTQTPPPTVVSGDARQIPLRLSADLIFTSPPYCSALDYTRSHMFSVAWLGDVIGTSVAKYGELGRRYVGTERGAVSRQKLLGMRTGMPFVDDLVDELRSMDRRQAAMVHNYFHDMRQILLECVRVLRRGGHLVIVVCPSHIRKVEIPTHKIFTEMADWLSRHHGVDLRCLAIHSRLINDHRRLMPYLESAFGPRMRSEYVVVLQKQ
jgi:DNA modification methylase